MKKIIALLAVLLLASCQNDEVEVSAKRTERAEVKPVDSGTVKPADSKARQPKLIVETFDGKSFDLADYRGKWVVVNFWATWCAPCLKEIPEFNAFAKTHMDVQFIGLAYEEIERQDMQAFLKKVPIDYPIAVLDVYNPPADFDTPRGLPMTVLIAPDGIVAEKFLGPVSTEQLQAAIDKAD